MSLVDDDTIEHEILSSRLALAMMDRASWEFSDLRSRIVQLEQRGELEPQDAAAAHVLARIVVDAWRGAGLTLVDWRELQPVLHDEFAHLVEEGYHETNRWLIERHVLPDVDLRPYIRRSPMRRPPRPAPCPAAAAAAVDSASGFASSSQFPAGESAFDSGLWAGVARSSASDAWAAAASGGAQLGPRRAARLCRRRNPHDDARRRAAAQLRPCRGRARPPEPAGRPPTAEFPGRARRHRALSPALSREIDNAAGRHPPAFRRPATADRARTPRSPRR
jgi:hypothetical protein